MEIIAAKNGVKYLYSPQIPVIHGFSTRVGGVSDAPHTASLNLAFGRGDSRETVLANLSLFAEAVGFDKSSIISVGQIHSADVVTVGAAERGLGYFRAADFCCDGYVTTEESLTLGVKTADCVPVLFYARLPQGKIAVSAVHSGWRGTVAKITSVALKKLRSLGADASEIKVAIGPAIGDCCFEIEADALAVFRERLGESFCRKFIIDGAERGISGKFFPDLPGIITALLTEDGIPAENIDASTLCTACDPELFYSHRASGGKRGTMLSVITPVFRKQMS